MGTVLEITTCNQANDTPYPITPNSVEALFTSASRLEALLSTFSQTSVVNQLNMHAGQGAFSVPLEVATLLTLSRHYWRLSQGTFDVTVGPLLTLWKTAAVTQTFPSSAILNKVRAKIGSDKIRILPTNQVSLTRSGMTIDLGGIGKGYALDRIADTLQSQGYHNALLDFGQSSIWALGAPPDAPIWRLLIQQPNGQNVGVISLRDQALSISASFGQHYLIQGRRYGHIIDPRTGMPMQRSLLACVIAANATQAEALSKALLILGEHQGVALLESLPSVEGLLVEAQGKQWMTRGWTQATKFTPEPTRMPAITSRLRDKPLENIPLDNETVTSKGE
jgi:FAD:protein FMN transferase